MVSNQELAKVFEEIYEILELKGSDRFRIIAYQRASQAIKSYGENLQTVYERGGEKELRTITGIGESIAAKIAQFIETGKVSELEILKTQAPKSEVEFLQIPGVGPKTAEKLFKTFKAQDVDELTRKLKEDGAKYFKPKSLNKILKGIEASKRLGTRKLLSEVRPHVEELLKYLKKSTKLKNVTAVGSYRRWKETVGDVDVIATAKDTSEAIAYFVKFPELIQIINEGETKSTAVHRAGFQVDLEILQDDEFGSLLQHFTGSKEHNVSLRTYAKSKDLSISEHGIKQMSGAKSGTLIKCAKEREVYENLKMDFIEPELREDRGEIKAALNHELPQLIEINDIKGDLHIHSRWSDGSASIDQLVQKAIELGYEFIAISDHTVSLGIAHGLSAEKFIKRQKEIESARKKYSRIQVLNSCEINIKLDGTLDLENEIMDTFDVVTASVHWSFGQSKEDMTSRIIKAIENPYVNIIGHPSGRLINEREAYQVDWQQIFSCCVKNNVALEINSFPQRLDLNDALVFEARKLGVKFVISTDAHQIDHMENMFYGVSVARRGWCEKNDILNSLSYDEFIKWLKIS